jgi:DnaD/phage-associated family protein
MIRGSTSEHGPVAPSGPGDDQAFTGFPGVARATAIPNLFFARVLPEMVNPGELLAFLWIARLVQEQRGDACFADIEDIWAEPEAIRSFEAFGGGREGLERGLLGCVELGALLGLEVIGPEPELREVVYFVNNPPSRRAVIRAKAGEISLKPRTKARDLPLPERPDIFRVYEEHIGTITPFVAEKLMAAQARFPWAWIEDAFREAADMNIRNWRYVERVLENWERQGRSHETVGRDTLEERKRRYLGGARGPIGYR